MVMGNAGWLPFVMPECLPDRKLRGHACRASTYSVMPECLCRASMLLFFLDSRQKIAGMTDGARDSRQKIAGMTFFCHARFIWGHVPIPSGFRYMSPVLCSYAKQVFLHAAGVGEVHARGLFEGDDVEIAYGINKLHRVLQCR